MLTSLLAGALMFISGYSCDPAHGQPYCGASADGTQVQVGVAACPYWMPFGTVLEIEDVGRVTCHDRYAPGLSDRIDVFRATAAECFALTGMHRVAVLEGE